jgi:hypothetical protein
MFFLVEIPGQARNDGWVGGGADYSPCLCQWHKLSLSTYREGGRIGDNNLSERQKCE